MSAKNYQIKSFSKNASGQSLLFWADTKTYVRTGETMPAMFDYDPNGELFRIEIVYLQSELRDAKGLIDSKYPVEGDDLVLQVGSDNPISLLLWVDRLYSKVGKTINADAWLLVDNDNNAVGIEFIVPN